MQLISRLFWLGLENSWRERKLLSIQFIIPYSLACQSTDTLNEVLHSSKERNTLDVKCSRRRVWETRHSGVTGWELLSHFSDVWCSSLLQLTRSSNWQPESLFPCQMWRHWVYVSNDVIKKENKSQLTWFYIIVRVKYVPLPQRYSITRAIHHWEELNCERDIKFRRTQVTNL